MKIAMLTAELPYPSNSGGRIYTWNRIKELSRLGHEIILYSFKENGENVEEKEILKYCFRINTYERNRSIFKILKNFFKPYSAITRYNDKLKEDLEKNNEIDIIIVDMPQLLYNLPKVKKLPIVLTQHNIEYRTFKNIGKNSRSLLKKINFYIESIKLLNLERKTYKSDLIDLFTFISLEDKEFFFHKFGEKKSILVPFGYNSVKKEEVLKEKKRIVFTGKMDYQPNKEAVMWFYNYIWPSIKKRVENVEFFIVGKNPSIEIIDLNCENVIVTGMVESVEKFIDSSDIIVIPLLSGGGVKIKLIEALGRENIVISTRKGIEGTLFEDKKHLLVADDAKEFAEKCIEVLNNKSKYKNLAQNARILIDEQYSWQAISKKYEVSLFELIKKH